MRTLKLCIVAFFLSFLCFPTLQYFYPFVKVDNVNENRQKLVLPKNNFFSGLFFDSTYTLSVEKYFLDNFPLRDLMLRCLGQFEYSILNRAREVVIGNDEYLADKKSLNVTLNELNVVDDEQIKNSILQIKRLENWLKNRGISFHIVIIPMKPSIYPEKYFSYTGFAMKRTGLERYSDALRRNEINYIDANNILKKQKNNLQLYYKTDMHWNSHGASLVAEAIINQLSDIYVGKKIWSEQYNTGEMSIYGGELLTMPLLFSKAEILSSLVSTDAGYKKEHLNDVEVYYGVDGKRAKLPSSIMFGNSFMLLYPDLGYHAYFKKSSRVLDYEYFSKVLDYIKPDHKIFILHIYENQLQFHLIPAGKSRAWSNFNGYWDPRINELPLPEGFVYQ